MQRRLRGWAVLVDPVEEGECGPGEVGLDPVMDGALVVAGGEIAAGRRAAAAGAVPDPVGLLFGEVDVADRVARSALQRSGASEVGLADRVAGFEEPAGEAASPVRVGLGERVELDDGQDGAVRVAGPGDDEDEDEGRARRCLSRPRT